LVLFQITSELIQAGDLPATSAVAWHEFVRGSVSEDDIVRADEVMDGRILSLDRETAEKAADLFRKTGSRRASTADCLIAATAILSDAEIGKGSWHSSNLPHRTGCPRGACEAWNLVALSVRRNYFQAVDGVSLKAACCITPSTPPFHAHR